jgi:hypothetical protein
MEREADLQSGGDSIVLYERWMSTATRRSCGDRGLQPRGLRLHVLAPRVAARAEGRGAGRGTDEIPWREPPESKEPKDDDLDEREALRAELLPTEPLLGRAARLPPARGEAGWWAFFHRLR